MKRTIPNTRHGFLSEFLIFGSVCLYGIIFYIQIKPKDDFSGESFDILYIYDLLCDA